MIWLAVIPDAALSTLDAESADIVFFRPPAGINAFPYTPTAEGFANPAHGSTTMSMLARYLLSAQPLKDLLAANVTDATTLRQFADKIQPNTVAPTSPSDPMQLATMFPAAFRPVGLERSLDQANKSHVLFLPLGADGGEPSYLAARAKGLKELLGSALRLLWTSCAVARDTETGPDVDARQLWLAGHSFGNETMRRCLDSNNTDVDRIMSFSATPRNTGLNPLMVTIERAVRERKKIAGTLDVFIAAAPDMIDVTNDKGENNARERRPISSETDRKLRRTGASITLIPDFDQQFDYYRLSPASSMNPFLRHLLGMWTNAEIENSAKSPHSWRFLFFHEYAVYGEVRVQGRFLPSFRSFFLEALGPPAPRPLP